LNLCNDDIFEELPVLLVLPTLGTNHELENQSQGWAFIVLTFRVENFEKSLSGYGLRACKKLWDSGKQPHTKVLFENFFSCQSEEIENKLVTFFNTYIGG
jgi:hypothetical protein